MLSRLDESQKVSAVVYNGTNDGGEYASNYTHSWLRITNAQKCSLFNNAEVDIMKNTNFCWSRLIALLLAAVMYLTFPMLCYATEHSTVRYGSSGDEVKTLQTMLNTVQSAGLTVDGQFGSNTLSAVKTFQNDYGLTADGIVGKNTWSKLESVYNQHSVTADHSTIRYGNSGSEVTTLQTILNAVQNANLTVDGQFGRNTLTAVKRFQKNHGLSVDGIVGTNTWAALDLAYQSSDATASITITDANYILISALGNYALNVCGASKASGANIIIWDKNADRNEIFKITASSDGYYYITSYDSGKNVDVYGGGSASGTNIQQYSANATDAQKFWFEDAGDGYYYIHSKLGGVIDVSGGTAAAGTNVQLYELNGTNAQKWKLIRSTNSDEMKTVNISAYSIDTWLQQVQQEERSLVGFGRVYTVAQSDKQVYIGNIIMDRTVLEYSQINVKIPSGQGPNVNYKTVTIALPSKIVYTLHKHNYQNKVTSSTAGTFISGLVGQKICWTQTCECGDSYVMTWEVPDFTVQAATDDTVAIVTTSEMIS